MSTISEYILLWEYDKPLDLSAMLNYEAGVFYWLITQPDNEFSDDSQNTIKYAVKSFRYDDIYFSRVTSLADLRLTDNSFYYDTDTTELYVRREDWKPLTKSIVFAGIATGFSLGNLPFAYFNNIYYGERISSILNIKKEKDQFYYGILKFQSGSVKLINNDGELDDWSGRNLFNQTNRILIGDSGDNYEDFDTIFTGLIGKPTRSWTDLNIAVEDVRKGMSASIATNLLNQTDWPYLDDNNVDKQKPVAYGDIFNAPCICLNETETSPTYYTFLLCDTYYNSVYDLDTVYVDGTAVSVYDYDYDAGTFRLTFAVAEDNTGNVTADFTVNIKNGVSIIKDLILNYDNRPYLSSFWDTDEVDAAYALARNTSVYVDDTKKLKDVIKDVADDIQGLFFPHDDGKYTIRIFDEDRTPVKTIYKDEWIDDPQIEDSPDEFLTSCIVKYRHNQDEDDYRQVENTDYQAEAFETYKNYNTETFETNLTTEADALAYSEDILQYRTSVPVIVSRSVKLGEHYDLEIMDFIICDPQTRVSEDPVWGIWEVIGIIKNMNDMIIGLTSRYIKSYTPIEYEYSYITYGGVNITYNGDPIIYREEV